jgi:hypothetical protein
MSKSRRRQSGGSLVTFEGDLVQMNFRLCLPTFIDVSQAHILDDAQGDRGWLENASPSAMAVEELPLGP